MLFDKLYEERKTAIIYRLLKCQGFIESSSKLNEFINKLIGLAPAEKKTILKTEYDQYLFDYIDIVNKFYYNTGLFDGFNISTKASESKGQPVNRTIRNMIVHLHETGSQNGSNPKTCRQTECFSSDDHMDGQFNLFSYFVQNAPCMSIRRKW